VKSLRAKITFFTIVILAMTSFFAAKFYESHLQLEKLQNDLHLSLELRGTADEVESKNLNPKKDPAEAVSYFKKWRNGIEEKPRMIALSNLIQALNTYNKDLRRRRFLELHETERRFHDLTLSKIQTQKKQFMTYLLFTLSTPLLGLFLFAVYFINSIVMPLQKLSQRMMDFLVDRYTFKLSQPANNEIGDLQRTFNSLAQRAINNVDELKALDRAKSEFVSIASHELRTPLTSIKGSLGLLSSGIVGDLKGESLGLIKIAEQETDRLVRLINNLLDLAKMESRTFKLQTEWISIPTLMESCRESLTGLSQTAQVEIEIHNPKEKIEASLDKDRIQQVVTNLISNAIKYSPKNDKVILGHFINEQNRLEITITDRGPGIAEHDQQLIFEKFRQATQPESKLVKGTGLGLAISKALVEEHGGTIHVQSKIGAGSTFSFTIPQWRVSPTLSETTQTQGEAA
jgi:signal transduction histidine kinase